MTLFFQGHFCTEVFLSSKTHIFIGCWKVAKTGFGVFVTIFFRAIFVLKCFCLQKHTYVVVFLFSNSISTIIHVICVFIHTVFISKWENTEDHF